MSSMDTTSIPGVFKRGGRYVATWRDPEGKPRKKAFRTQKEAAAHKKAQEVAKDQGTYAPDTTVTLHGYYADWIAAADWRSSTRDGYERAWRLHIAPHFGPKARLSRIGRRDVRRFYAALKEAGVGPGALEKAARVLSSLLSAAVEEELIRANPALGVRVPRPPEQPTDEDDVRFLSDEQLATVLAVAAPRYRLLFELLAATGLRVGEALALQWRHLQLDGPRPHVKVRQQLERGGEFGPPKTKRGRREVALPFGLVRSLRAAAGESTALVFASYAGTPLDYYHVLARGLKPALEEAGVSEGGFHLFRHTFASRHIARGTNIVALQRAMGHSKPSVTLDVYSHLLEGYEAPALETSEVAQTAAEIAALPVAS
jgi:integrase